MAIYSSPPHPSLQYYINVYLYYDQREPTPPQIIAATGQQFLWAILEGTVHITHPVTGSFKAPPIGMIGHFSHASKVQQTYPSRAAAISFKPFSCNALFGMDMQPLQNNYVDISTALLNNDSLFYILQKCCSIEQIKEVFDKWLIQQLRNMPHDTTMVQQVIESMEQRNGNTTVEEIIKDFNITERTLQRWFKKVIGINPKLYLRIVRFNYVISQLELSSTPLKEIMYDAGYFDQSHFIKDFLQFTGCNPSIFKNNPAMVTSRETVLAILKSMY